VDISICHDLTRIQFITCTTIAQSWNSYSEDRQRRTCNVQRWQPSFYRVSRIRRDEQNLCAQRCTSYTTI